MREYLDSQFVVEDRQVIVAHYKTQFTQFTTAELNLYENNSMKLIIEKYFVLRGSLSIVPFQFDNRIACARCLINVTLVENFNNAFSFNVADAAEISFKIPRISSTIFKNKSKRNKINHQLIVNLVHTLNIFSSRHGSSSPIVSASISLTAASPSLISQFIFPTNSLFSLTRSKT